MEGTLIGSSKPIHDVTKDALAELMTQQTTVLGVIWAQLQALQVRPLGMMTPYIVDGIDDVDQMLRAHTTNTMVLTEALS